MKVNHKTFSGGYGFKGFEGQPSDTLVVFRPESDVADLAIKSGEGISASEVLDALGLTAFNGPDSAMVPLEGTIEPAKVKDILINAVEVEPYDLPNEVLVNKVGMGKFFDGLKALRTSYSQAKVTLVVGEDQEKLQQLLFPTADNLSWLEVCTITSKYPANVMALQVQTVLGKKYPVGYDPAHIGVLSLSVSDVLTVEKVLSGQGADMTYVALSGTGWKENVLLEVPVGTPVKAIIDKYMDEGEVRIIKNSVITGEVLAEDAVVTYDTRVIIGLPEDRRRQSLFFLRSGANVDSFSNSFISRLMPNAVKRGDTNVHGERRACVSCTYCQNVCPVGLMPHLLHKHVNKDIINNRLAEYKIFDCIECGLCDYVCPSKIEISTDIKTGKDKLEKNGISHNKYVIPQCDMILEPKEVAADE